MYVPILDCDNTLYRCDDLFSHIGDKIVEFMQVRLAYPVEKIHDVRRQYWREYGTTLSGLIKHSNVNPKEYLEFIHDVCLSDFIEHDPNLRPLLLSLNSKIIIMSNAPRKHVLEVLSILGISDIPEKIFGIEDFSYEGKPFISSYNHVFEKTGLSAEETIMFDDAPQNLVGAKQAGMKTCLVGESSSGYSTLNVESPETDFDHVIPDISHIERVLSNRTNTEE